jgi:hypothetical protein
MARPSLLDRRALPDALLLYNWRVVFPRIPGVSDTRGLTVRAVSSTIPGFKIEPAEQQFPGGVKIKWAGQPSWDGTWSCTLIETRDMLVRDSFITWMLSARNPHNNTGSLKSSYATTVELELYDDIPNVIRSISLVNVFPTSVGDLSVDASSGVANMQIDFAYDFTTESNSSST